MELNKKSEENKATIFLSKKDFVDGFTKRKYSYVDEKAFVEINSCKNDHDILRMVITTGSALKVLNAEKIDEKKFIELVASS